MVLRILFTVILIFYFGSCVSHQERLPSSSAEIYSNRDVQQSLLVIAQNNVMINVPEATTREHEKVEIDFKCKQNYNPIWADKLTQYLREFRKRPELLSRINVIEMKRADKADIVLQKDLDGAVVLSIQFVKMENYARVTPQTKIPCNGSVVEYLGRDLVSTQYDFPKIDKMVLVLNELPEKKQIARFQFSNDFLIYLAERGVLFKFSHDASFEKTADGKYVMSEILNKLAEESKSLFHQHLNFWFKQIHNESTQAQLIQWFSVFEDKELKVGVRVDLKSEISQKTNGEADQTYLYLTYNVENNRINSAGLKQLDKCLEGFTEQMSGLKFRKPAASDKESFLRPGYSCLIGLEK